MRFSFESVSLVSTVASTATKQGPFIRLQRLAFAPYLSLLRLSSSVEYHPIRFNTGLIQNKHRKRSIYGTLSFFKCRVSYDFFLIRDRVLDGFSSQFVLRILKQEELGGFLGLIQVNDGKITPTHHEIKQTKNSVWQINSKPYKIV